MTTESSLEARVAHVEGIVEELRNRLASIENRLARLEDRVLALEARLTTEMQDIRESVTKDIQGLSDRIDNNLRWTVGIMVSVMVTLWVTTIVAVLLRT